MSLSGKVPVLRVILAMCGRLEINGFEPDDQRLDAAPYSHGGSRE